MKEISKRYEPSAAAKAWPYSGKPMRLCDAADLNLQDIYARYIKMLGRTEAGILVIGVDYWQSCLARGLMVTGDRVLVRGMVRDTKPRRMSFIQNTVDPAELVARYGADVFRISLLAGVSLQKDIRFYERKAEAMHAFCNKLWNAGRFIRLNLNTAGGELPHALEAEDERILCELNRLTADVERHMVQLQFGLAFFKIYNFVRKSYCGCYIEQTKSIIYGENEKARIAVQKVHLYVFMEILMLLHPFVPFITEEIWQSLPCKNVDLLKNTMPLPNGADEARY